MGKQVIVRGTSSGVYFGELSNKNNREIILSNCRRILAWDTVSNLSELSKEGLKDEMEYRFTEPVDELTILDAVEILPCTENSAKSIEQAPAWRGY